MAATKRKTRASAAAETSASQKDAESFISQLAETLRATKRSFTEKKLSKAFKKALETVGDADLKRALQVDAARYEAVLVDHLLPSAAPEAAVEEPPAKAQKAKKQKRGKTADDGRADTTYPYATDEAYEAACDAAVANDQLPNGGKEGLERLLLARCPAPSALAQRAALGASGLEARLESAEEATDAASTLLQACTARTAHAADAHGLLGGLAPVSDMLRAALRLAAREAAALKGGEDVVVMEVPRDGAEDDEDEDEEEGGIVDLLGRIDTEVALLRNVLQLRIARMAAEDRSRMAEIRASVPTLAPGADAHAAHDVPVAAVLLTAELSAVSGLLPVGPPRERARVEARGDVAAALKALLPPEGPGVEALLARLAGGPLGLAADEAGLAEAELARLNADAWTSVFEALVDMRPVPDTPSFHLNLVAASRSAPLRYEEAEVKGPDAVEYVQKVKRRPAPGTLAQWLRSLPPSSAVLGALDAAQQSPAALTTYLASTMSESALRALCREAAGQGDESDGEDFEGGADDDRDDLLFFTDTAAGPEAAGDDDDDDDSELDSDDETGGGGRGGAIQLDELPGAEAESGSDFEGSD